MTSQSHWYWLEVQGSVENTLLYSLFGVLSKEMLINIGIKMCYQIELVVNRASHTHHPKVSLVWKEKSIYHDKMDVQN